MVEANKDQGCENQISTYIAYRIVASAASYLLYYTTNILPFKTLNAEVREDLSKDSVSNVGVLNNVDMMNGDVASLIATTDSVTSVVGAKEEVKQTVADDLNSTSSIPCEWFVCYDDQTTTRFFAIQVVDLRGSEVATTRNIKVQWLLSICTTRDYGGCKMHS